MSHELKTPDEIDALVAKCNLAQLQPKLKASLSATDPATKAASINSVLVTLWPAVKAILNVLSVFLFFKPSWKALLSQFIAFIDSFVIPTPTP